MPGRPVVNSPFAKPADKVVALILPSLRLSAGKRRTSATVVPWPLPPDFLQVLILKELKVICFHTLLQVFILKDLREIIRDGSGTPVPTGVPAKHKSILEPEYFGGARWRRGALSSDPIIP
jgi:hypothetical protein